MLPLDTVTCRSACLQCITACQACLMLHPSNPDTEAVMQRVSDCSDACRLLLDYIARDSRSVQTASIFCAEVCEICADECADVPDDLCQECADVSWACAAVCRWSWQKAVA
jgi:hypothetical protein